MKPRLFRAAASLALSITAAAVVVLQPVPVEAGVDYVQICSLYGQRFYYLPESDGICYNPSTNDARQATDGGTWRWRTPNSPSQTATSGKKLCKGGRLVELGTIAGNTLTPTDYERYETAHFPLGLDEGQFIASVIFKGGFTGDATGNFCMFYYYDDPTFGPSYTTIGCLDTAAHALEPQVTAFVTDAPLPPAAPVPVYLVGANGDPWEEIDSAAEIGGSLTISVCLQKARI